MQLYFTRIRKNIEWTVWICCAALSMSETLGEFMNRSLLCTCACFAVMSSIKKYCNIYYTINDVSNNHNPHPFDRTSFFLRTHVHCRRRNNIINCLPGDFNKTIKLFLHWSPRYKKCLPYYFYNVDQYVWQTQYCARVIIRLKYSGIIFTIHTRNLYDILGPVKVLTSSIIFLTISNEYKIIQVDYIIQL